MDKTWGSITKEELKQLYFDDDLCDNQIADIFGITKGKVTYKRKKFDISFKNKVYEDLMNENSELFKKLNADSKDRLLKRENIDSIAKAITHFSFRNGPSRICM